MAHLIAWHSAQTYPHTDRDRTCILSASGPWSVRDQNKRRNLADHQQRGASGAQWAQRATALLWTLRPRSPLPPPSPLGKGSKWSLICASWTLSPFTAAPLRCKDVPGEAQLLDDRSSIPNGKYSPSESESANNICNTSSRYIFSHKSHNLLANYELNCFRINDTIGHLLKVLHVCDLVVENTNEILHHIRNYSLFY